MHGMSSRARIPSPKNGLTLVEMLVVLTLIAIVAALAYPDYSDRLHRARRADARESLLAIQVAQARFRGIHGHYARDLGELGWPKRRSTQGHYALALDPSIDPADGFVAHARPWPGDAQEDDDCLDIRLGPDGPIGDAAGTCWR